jgi:lipopolysaccharide export system protein LptC
LKAITEALTQLQGVKRFLLLGGLALASWWAAEHFGPPVEKGNKLQPGKVDYYSKELRRTVMDETGKAKEMLVADELVHYENDNRSELTNPVMTLFQKEGPPWVIHAESATLPGDGKQIFLNGDVLVLRDANRDGRTMRIETSNARVRPDDNYAETDEDIRVISPPDYMKGTGATMKFGDGIQYSVLANVRRKHEVQQK